MSRTSETQYVDGEIHCNCGKTLGKADGIKCRCGNKSAAIHFYPASAIGGGSVEDDWKRHIEQAGLVGCEVCGIQPRWKTQKFDPAKAREIHFYPGSAIGGGSIEKDWERHRREAAVFGCGVCGIEPSQPLVGNTTQERYDYAQMLLSGRTPHRMQCTKVAATVAEPDPVADAKPASTGSHSLASRYVRVPSTLDTIGTDYALPVFPADAPNWLAGARVLVISADGPELPELEVPMEYLRARGADVKLAGQDWIFQWRTPAAHIVVAEWLSDAICIKADLRLSDVRVEDFDAIFVPGGAWNPDMLRGDGVALRIIRRAHELGKLVVSLCHGPQVLISAAFDAPEGETNFPSKGVHITGTGSIRRDLINAGFVVHNDDATVFDKGANLLTARDPNDLGPLCQQFGMLLAERLASSN